MTTGTPPPTAAWRRKMHAALAALDRLEDTVARGRHEAAERLPGQRGQTPTLREALGRHAFDRSETGRQLASAVADAHRTAQTYALAILADRTR